MKRRREGDGDVSGVQCGDDRFRIAAAELYREASHQSIERSLGSAVAVPSAKSVIRNRTNASRKKYRDRSLPPGKQGKKMLCDERGPDAVNSKDLGHHRCFKLPEAFFRTDVSPDRKSTRLNSSH